MHGRGYGMPSSHSQFSSFFAVYIALLLLRRGLGGRDLPEWRRRTYVALAAAGSVAVAASRVYLCYHTKKQVLVGYTAGVVCAVGWYMVTAWMRETEVVWELVMWVGGLFWVRDRCLQEDLVVAGWRAAQGGVEKKVR